MQTKSIKNQYLGVNAHLHSFWQSEAGSGGIHLLLICDILKTLKAVLHPIGYTADLIESLQIRRIGGEIDYEHPYSAIEIRPLSESNVEAALIGWIELLSPSNKGGSDAQAYNAKRAQFLDSGLVFVEIDYLHETPPFWNVSNDTHNEPNTYPYQISVLDPRPTLNIGKAYRYPFAVDAPIPKVEIPLNKDDTLTIDFGLPYRKTFEEGMYGYNLDYARLPINFDRYSEADQTRIAARMLSVLEAARDGIDLESGPFPVKPLRLAESLAQIEAITGDKFA